MIFKHFTSSSVVHTNKISNLTKLFGNVAHVSKSVSGWDYALNYAFSESPSITSSVAFVDTDKFYVSYASDLTSSNYAEVLPWNNLMSTVGANFNLTDSLYHFYVGNDRIREAIIISFNEEYFSEGIDIDNFFIVLSGSTANGTSTQTNNNFSVSNNLVLAPFYIKPSGNNVSNANEIIIDNLSPTYELRTTDSNSFLSYNVTSESIKIDWSQGVLNSTTMGYIYPEVGLVILFPQLFSRTQITDAIRDTNNLRTVNSLNSIMWIGGYGEVKKERKIFFLRVESDEFNLTLNPTSYEKDASNRTKKIGILESNPRTFITKIGLYNEYNELLAVGNLSQPEMKDDLEFYAFRIQIDT